MCHEREYFFFNGCGTEGDAFENVGVENVDSGVDAVGYEFYWFFNEFVDAGGGGMHYYYTVFGRFFDFCDDDGAFAAVLFVEVNELEEGVVLQGQKLEGKGGIRDVTQMTSELRTKKGESSLARMSFAKARGPAVPRGSVSTEKVIFTLYCSSYYTISIHSIELSWSD